MIEQAERDTREAVDRLLLEQGVYTPVELLLAEGRLHFGDYESWRSGDIDHLEKALFGDPARCREMLQQAADYVKALGFRGEVQHYETWGEASGRRLRFSGEDRIDELYRTVFRKHSGLPQMDLFMDTAGVVLCNKIERALVRRHYREAHQLLNQLSQNDPGNIHLGSLERLVEATDILNTPVEDAAAELHWLDNELKRLVDERLGGAASQFLAPFWRRLMTALDGVAFSPDQPQLHPSYAALNAQDWKQAKQVIESVPAWRTQPILLRRHARAAGRLQIDGEAASSWFRLFWHFPDQAEHISVEAEPAWQRAWEAFIELDPELPNRDFPAWIVLKRRALAYSFINDESANDESVPEDFRLFRELMQFTRDGVVVEAEINKRKALQTLNPDFFAYFRACAFGR